METSMGYRQLKGLGVKMTRFIFIAISVLSLKVFAILDGEHARFPRNLDQIESRNRTVRIVIANGGRYDHVCTAAITSADEVLTAGHCLKKNPIKKMRQGQMFAEVALPGPPHIKRIRVRDGRHKVEFPVDLALLKLEEEFPMQKSMPITDSGCDLGSVAETVGFGFKDQDENFATLPRRTSLSHVGRGQGLVGLDRVKGMPCKGDSGSPVVCRSKGQLSLLTVISFSQDHKPHSVNRDGWTAVQRCGKNNRIFGTDLSQQKELIEKWRRELQRQVRRHDPIQTTPANR